MMLNVGSRVRIKENAYEGSTEPADLEARGKVGVVVFSLADGTWEVQTDDGEFELLTTDELEEIDD